MALNPDGQQLPKRITLVGGPLDGYPVPCPTPPLDLVGVPITSEMLQLLDRALSPAADQLDSVLQWLSLPEVSLDEAETVALYEKHHDKYSFVRTITPQGFRELLIEARH